MTLVSSFLKHLQPPKRLTVSQWADEYRMLSAEASAEPGRWRTSRAPYQRGIMDAFSDPAVHTIVVMSSAQVGKTEIVNNIVGYFVDQDPAPMLVLQPTLEMAQAWSKDRLAPMLRDTPALQGRVKDPRSRDSGNTLLHKTFPGGHITMAGANSPASLASRPIRVVLCDEVDRYPISAGSEGDPVSLAFKRTTTFWNRKLALMSTPTIKGASRIELAFNQSDQRYYLVSCPDCGHLQRLTWANVKFQNREPATALYYCANCGCGMDDAARYSAISSGQWLSTAQFNGIAGFHLSELYSTWRRLEETVEDFLRSKDDTELLKTWTNTAMGETWEIKGDQADEHVLMERREDYTGVPEEVLLLTAGVDTQDDRLEVEVIGWGDGEESWSIAVIIIYGSPGDDKTWDDLAMTLDAEYDGHRIAAVMIDTGGHFTQKVYEFVYKHKRHKRWFAIKGSNEASTPIVGKTATVSIGEKKKVGKKTISGRTITLHHLGVTNAKENLLHMLKLSEPGPGFMHFSLHINDEEYFLQLTAEALVTKMRAGVPYREFVKTRARNEALDRRVYGYSAMKLLNPNWKALAEKPKDADEKKPKVRVKKRANTPSWVKRR